jgi:RNA polymerase sigma-70 factor (ECF subfamily)
MKMGRTSVCTPPIDIDDKEDDQVMESKLILLIESKFDALNPYVQKEIYQEFYNLVYSTIIYIVKEHAATEDIIQDSFLKLLTHLPNVDTVVRLKSWIKVVIRNTSFNYLRKHKKNRNEVDMDGVFNHEHSTSATETTEAQIELKMMTEAINQCLNEIKVEYRTLIELRWKKELSYKEIAEQIGSTEETVKHQLHKARQTIKKRFQKDWDERK